MRIVLRYLPSILFLPVLIVIVVPTWLLNAFTGSDSRWSNAVVFGSVSRFIGVAIICVGFVLFCWCVTLFARVGQGTLAPWDPPQHLVAVGPYRHVRNPMIISVALMLTGLALYWGSWVLVTWAGLFVLINHIYFVLYEEQGLERRYGESYRVYKDNTPRWFPRRKSR